MGGNNVRALDGLVLAKSPVMQRKLIRIRVYGGKIETVGGYSIGRASD